MKKILFLIAILICSLNFAQVTLPKNSKTPPPAHYQKEVDLAKDLTLKFIEKEKIPGIAIAVSKNGDIIFSDGMGFGNIEKQTKVIPNKTQFRIASISKTITAYAMGILADEGKLVFNESIYTYLPNYPKKKYNFTIKQVSGHIAGIRHYNGKEFLLNKKMSITEGLDIFKNDSLLFKPGTDYKYSTYGWNLLSEVIQKITNQPFSDYMNNTVFKPLKMDNTFLEISDVIVPNKTQFYNKTNKGKIFISPEVNNEFKAAGGGFLSTAHDLILFGNEVIKPTLVDKNTINELVESQITNKGKKTNYGVGFVSGETKKGTPVYSHSGGAIGATTLLLMYPEEEVVIVILTNLTSVKIKDFGKELENVFVK